MYHILKSLKDTPSLSTVQVVLKDNYTKFLIMLGSKKAIFVKLIIKNYDCPKKV